MQPRPPLPPPTPLEPYLQALWCTIPAEVELDLHRAYCDPPPMQVRFLYYPQLPYAVYLLFPSPVSRTVIWEVSRDLLREGRYRSVGDGWVVVAPAPDQRVQVLLRPPAGSFIFTFAREHLDAFLLRSAHPQHGVPFGTESMTVDVDRCLDQLLR